MSLNKSAFITGVSRGLGKGFLEHLLEKDYKIYAIGLHPPPFSSPNIYFLRCNLEKRGEIAPILKKLFSSLKDLSLVILNAGILPPVEDISKTPFSTIEKVMQVNVWANKEILDFFLQERFSIDTIIGISSGASKSLSRGWNVYAISKVSLNALIKLYSYEFSNSYLISLAPGLILSNMQEYIYSLDPSYEEKFPTIKRLKKAYPTMPKGKEVAKKILDSLPYIQKNYPSGSYVDIRDL